MNAPDDPGPERSRPRLRTRLSTSWTHAARRAYAAATPREISSAVLSTHAKRAACAALEYSACHAAALDAFSAQVLGVEISFVADAEMRQLNHSHRGKNKPTDVLSFSQIEGEAFPIAGGETILGDLVISIETAARQAAELRHDLKREIAFLTIHGVLHLCGFDHDTASHRRAMWKHQDAIMAILDSHLDSQKPDKKSGGENRC